AHALACAVERRRLKDPPPEENWQRRRWWLLRLLPLLICAGSFGTDLSRGQVDVLMLAAIAWGIYLAARSRDFLAGGCFAFAAAIKLFPVLLLFYPAWRLRWRMAAGAATGLFLTLIALPAITLGPKQTVVLYQKLNEVLTKPAFGQGTDTT